MRLRVRCFQLLPRSRRRDLGVPGNHRQWPDGHHAASLLFVDSESGFGYSGDLARCCAWGLCVGVSNDGFRRWGVHPDRLVDSPDGVRLEQATGCWMRGKIGASSAKPKPFEGQPPQFSPEQICLEVGRNRARARFAWAKALCAWFYLDGWPVFEVWPGRFF